MDIRQTLEQIGLSHNETKAYLALLKLGSASAGKISKEASVDRSATYDSLKRLLEKGVISYNVVAGKKVFRAIDPQNLVNFLKEKQDLAERVMPQLTGMFKLPKEKHDVTLYYGLKGIKSIFQDIIRTGKDNLMFGSEGQFGERMPYYAPLFLKQKKEKGIKTRAIVRIGRKSGSRSLTERRYIEKKTVSPVVTNIYGNKIAIIVWSDTPEGVIIENKQAADSYREFFEVMWGAAKR
ncbi:TrmB family transcriptional regulator [Nanoarchaeota archaeon]